MNSTSRFRFRRPEKRTGIPHEWGTSAAPAMTREQICTLFDSATCQAYGQNTAAWDRVLELLNFSLSLQPAVAHILQQARWRTSKDPKAYVATVAWRQYQAMNLVDYDGHEFRVLRQDAGDHDSDHNPDISVDHLGNDRPISELERFDNLCHRVAVREHLYDDGGPPEIPAWLAVPGEPDRVDWAVVAKHAALKPHMAASLAETLELRFARGLSREAALMTAKGPERKRRTEAAWRWIDRNMAGRIEPLFRMAAPPVRTAPRASAPTRSFVPPGEALRRTLAAKVDTSGGYVSAPSLTQPIASLVAPPGVSLTWGASGSSAVLWDSHCQFGLEVKERTPELLLLAVREVIRDWEQWKSEITK